MHANFLYSTLWLLVAWGLPFSLTAQVNINIPEYFPDPAFRAVAERAVGVSPGQFFTADQTLKVKSIICSDRDLRNLTGIHYFAGLETLDCSYNQITILDLAGNPAVEQLNCSNNQLATLDLAAHTALYSLSCSDNQLTDLDLSHNPILAELQCGGNQLSALDLTRSPELSGIDCSNNQLGTLDLFNNPDLRYLICSNNQLATLDLSHNPNLQNLFCVNNRLHTISGWVALTGWELGGFIDITLNYLNGGDCPDLQALQQRGVELSFSPQRMGVEEVELSCPLKDVPGWGES